MVLANLTLTAKFILVRFSRMRAYMHARFVNREIFMEPDPRKFDALRYPYNVLNILYPIFKDYCHGQN